MSISGYDGGVANDEGDDAALEAQRDANGRALASVLRMRILRLCLDDALTNQEIAARLGRNPATTYHHVRLLAERGFLAAEPERRGTRGAREIPYRATRASWHAPMPVGQQDRLLIETFLEEVAEADPTMTTTGRLGMRLGPQGHEELDPTAGGADGGVRRPAARSGRDGVLAVHRGARGRGAEPGAVRRVPPPGRAPSPRPQVGGQRRLSGRCRRARSGHPRRA